jgi:hypothetical protein
MNGTPFKPSGLGSPDAGVPKLSDLPIFDRYFLLCYFLPSFIAALIAARFVHGVQLEIPSQITLNNPIVITLLCSLIVALSLLTFNRSITRLLEGYGLVNPFRLFGYLEHYRFRKLTRRRDDLINMVQQSKNPNAHLEAELGAIGTRLAQEFPDEEEYLLPTRFGNAVRAFEIYSRVMYGFEATEGWARLLGVIPVEFRTLLDSAEAQTSVWVNVWFLSLLVILDSVLDLLYRLQEPRWIGDLVPNLASHADLSGAIADLRGTSDMLWSLTVNPGTVLLTLIGALVVGILSVHAARQAAFEWGSVVKASVDLYLPELGRKLNLPADGDAGARYRRWLSFSQAMIYRQPNVLPERDSAVKTKK